MNRKVQIDGVYRHCNTWWLDIGKNVRKVVVPCGRFAKAKGEMTMADIKIGDKVIMNNKYLVMEM